jgi:hypothetical protein
MSLENPCVGGSIPPRATKNIVHKTPTIAAWRFFVDSASAEDGADAIDAMCFRQTN